MKPILVSLLNLTRPIQKFTMRRIPARVLLSLENFLFAWTTSSATLASSLTPLAHLRKQSHVLSFSRDDKQTSEQFEPSFHICNSIVHLSISVSRQRFSLALFSFCITSTVVLCQSDSLYSQTLFFALHSLV